MKISEVIKKLQEIQKEHGDIEVMAYDAVYFDATEESFYVDKDNKLYIGGQLWNTGKIQEQTKYYAKITFAHVIMQQVTMALRHWSIIIV